MALRDKRSKKIDELLAHPMHAALWATRYLDITGCDVAAMEGPENLRPRRAQDVARLVPQAVRRQHSVLGNCARGHHGDES